VQLGSGTPRWVWVVGALVAVAVVWRLTSCGGRARTVDVGVVCTSCQFRGNTAISASGADWPIACPKCGKRTAYIARACAQCTKPIPWDPKAPPKQCPHCNASTGEGEGEEPAP